MGIAASVFFVALLGLVLFFALKAYEVKHERVIMPRVRASLDGFAVNLKRQLLNARHMLSRVPPLLVLLSRYALHEMALAFARLARAAEAQAHRIADLVSHKRSFERRPGRTGEPRNEFLKQVGELRNGQDENKEM